MEQAFVKNVRPLTTAPDGQVRRLAEVEAVFRTLPERYLGADPGFDATWHIVLGDVGHTWEVRCTTFGARVRRGISSRRPDVVIGTDVATWLELRRGETSGIVAFGERRLYARGNVDLAIGFEGMFRRDNGSEPLMRIHRVEVPGSCVSTLTMGEGPDVLLIHGLGGAKSSFFDTAAALSHRYRVHVVDLPGFGSSSKPTRAPYNARWFAATMRDLMDTLGIERAHVVGNSMGGRVGIEMGLRYPERVGGLGLLCPAVAFVKRAYHPIVRLLRPELGILPHRFSRGMVSGQFWDLIADRDNVDPGVGDIGCDEFRRIYSSAGARLAFLSSARNIYLDAPFGPNGFYPRLAELQAPALFIWGSHDKLIPPAFARHVERWLPGAEQIVLEGCGHVPQIERAAQTTGLLQRFLGRVEALGSFEPARREAA